MTDTSEAYEKVTWRGHRFDRRTRAAVLELEDRLGKRVTIYQGSYNGGGVAASGGTHDGGGAVDLWVSGVDPNLVVVVARRIGWAFWYRSIDEGPWAEHCHGILREHKTASPTARDQWRNYDAGGDGLWPLVGGDDPQPYRPHNAPVTFSYRTWVRRQNLRSKLRHLGRDIAALKDRRRKVRKQLATLGTS